CVLLPRTCCGVWNQNHKKVIKNAFLLLKARTPQQVRGDSGARCGATAAQGAAGHSGAKCGWQRTMSIDATQ
ncbi:MAG: hypothetical protein ABI370_00625, partial [Gammaproteobacteria bacterium]